MKQLSNPYKSHFFKNPLYTFLAQYISKNFNKWTVAYVNVVGVDISKKEVGGSVTQEYAIVFHVAIKTDLISASESIPPYFKVLYKGRFIKVPTDVIHTGRSILNHISPGRNVCQFDHANNIGTIGLIVIKGNIPHILSNMHVLGWAYLNNVKEIIDKPINYNARPDISSVVNDTIRPSGYFRSGKVNSEIDAAIAVIPQQLYHLINDRRDILDIENPIVLPPQPIANPIPVRMMGCISGFKDTFIVSSTAAKSFPYPFGTQNFVNLLALSPCCSVPGDSGSPVYDPISRRIIGIILGTDEQQRYSFVISYHKIESQLQIF